MCKTVGAKKKDTGEPIYDAYPLKKLAQVLCFEDADEARAACKHYNITVKVCDVRSGGQSGQAEIVFCKHTDFKEPKDPDKGTILPLRPRKMLKYIESKLHRTTRLGVCRGEVAGEGSSLLQAPAKTSRVVNPNASASVPPAFPQAPVVPPVSSSAAAPTPADDEARNAQDLQKRTEAEAKKQEAEMRAKLKAEQERRMQLEQLRLEKQKEASRKLEERKQLEVAKRAELKRKKLEAEQQRKEKEELEEVRFD